eukprot:6613471-Pyramimonas_sp.AAC.1
MAKVTGIARRLTARPRLDVAAPLTCPSAGEMRVAILAVKKSRRVGRAASHSPTLCRLVKRKNFLLLHRRWAARKRLKWRHGSGGMWNYCEEEKVYTKV